ncbi:hypothetical protein [Oleiharenicola lentus]|uniref:hypothetical protein n=1 Tax=Oleiharenicola lentus TaxID=2508720 RepID=UPI003F670798
MSEAPSNPMPEDEPTSRTATLYRRAIFGLAAASLVIAWLAMTHLSRSNPWYNNTEMNLHNTVDALALNSREQPGLVDQPGLPSKFLLALDYRVRHNLGQLPVWNFKTLDRTADPLRELPPLLRIARMHSRGLIILFILTGAALVYSVTREIEAALLATILLSASAGLLFHGLHHKPDLLCAWFGAVLGPFGLWRAAISCKESGRCAWLFFVGMAASLATLAKLPGVCYLITVGLSCWLFAVCAPVSPKKPSFAIIAVPVICSALLFWLLDQFCTGSEALTSVAALRLRIAAGLIGILPAVELFNFRHRFFVFLVSRIRELVWLGAGAAATALMAYGALSLLMTKPQATEYLARTLQFLSHPDPEMKYLLAPVLQPATQFLLFVRESPFLFLTATAAMNAMAFYRKGSPQLRVFVFFLWLNAVALAGLLAHRYFLDQFSVFFQVPLLLVATLSLSAFRVWTRESQPGHQNHWITPLVLTGAAVLVVTMYFRLEPKDHHYRTETLPPVDELTKTYLYNHAAHPTRYREIMEKHYATRAEFTEALQRYLKTPGNRL